MQARLMRLRALLSPGSNGKAVNHDDGTRPFRHPSRHTRDGGVQWHLSLCERDLRAPQVWYDFVPGVADTGFYNQHFIRDIGIIQLFLGVAFGVGLFRPERRIGLWAVATLWLCAHALFHFWEVAVGICSPSVIPRDFPAVTMPALFGALAR
jgi:hypothetical protein